MTTVNLSSFEESSEKYDQGTDDGISSSEVLESSSSFNRPLVEIIEIKTKWKLSYNAEFTWTIKKEK